MSRHVRLDSFCTIVQGGRQRLTGYDFVDQGFPAYGAGGVNGNLSTAEFDKPAIVLSAIGARCGKCFYADGKWSSLANTQLIFPDLEVADPRFLYFQLNDEARWHRSGSAQPFIKPSDVKSHDVFLPPIEEQRRIAAILDKADELRTKRRAALAQLDTLTEAIFIDMFGDPKRHAVSASAWPLVPLMDLCRPRQWPTISQNEFVAEGYPVYGANGVIGFYTSFNHEHPTVLITCRGATCGTINVCAPKSYVTGNAMALDDLDEKRLDRDFLVHALRQGNLSQAISGTAQPQITRSSLAVVTIPLPPIEEQRRFGQLAAQIGLPTSMSKQSAVAIESFFAGLQQRAFSGAL